MSQTATYVWPFRYEARHTTARPLKISAKRVFDIVLSITALVFAAPLILICALLVKRDGGTALFGQERIGRHGRPFTCWKLRTMCPDADQKLDSYLAENPAARKLWQSERKLKDDPRITPLGRLLRKSSLDELPQFWNVLRGDMSLVGPRPVVRDELKLHGSCRMLYMALRPGLTGKWQVSGRNAVSYAERVAIDARYALNHNLLEDTAILVRTVFVMVRMSGR